jgi:hypothetical protein
LRTVGSLSAAQTFSRVAAILRSPCICIGSSSCWAGVIEVANFLREHNRGDRT